MTVGGLIHPTALVDPAARLGAGVTIGPWCQVGPGVTLGERVRLHAHVVIDGDATLDADVTVYPFCTIGLPPQDLKYRGEPTRTEIGPRTQLREHCTIHRGTVTGTGLTRIGADCLLMAVTHVAHDCEIGDGVIIANNVVMGGHVTIGDHAVIGGSAAIHQFVRIGRAAMVGGVSGVEADVIPFGSVLGNRARLAGLNLIGLKRRGIDHAQRHRLRTAFRRLFAGPGVFQSRLAGVRQDFGQDPLVAELLRFIDAPSKRGLIRTGLEPDEERGADAA